MKCHNDGGAAQRAAFCNAVVCAADIMYASGTAPCLSSNLTCRFFDERRQELHNEPHSLNVVLGAAHRGEGGGPTPTLAMERALATSCHPHHGVRGQPRHLAYTARGVAGGCHCAAGGTNEVFQTTSEGSQVTTPRPLLLCGLPRIEYAVSLKFRFCGHRHDSLVGTPRMRAQPLRRL